MAFHNLIIVVTTIITFAFSLPSISEGRFTITGDVFKEFVQSSSSTDGGAKGTKWAVLVAGSNGYWNYRHQADICHAYQIMKRGGLKDENIIVFMYDDIAYNKDNPRPGVIINNPHGKNVYPGVPKDYTGTAVNPSNLYGVILGNKTAVKGGSGKVVKSGPNDHVFIYYADHGGPGILGMPDDVDVIYANDFIKVLKKKHALKSYKRMVIYVEACESGSIFDGLLPKNMSIYAITAANPEESSYATYCGFDVPIPKEYKNDTCLGDVFSVSWMEDSDKHDPQKETLEEQYKAVKKRTNDTEGESSHVMQYGDLGLSKDFLAVYLVANSSKGNHTHLLVSPAQPIPLVAVEQRDADLVYFKGKVRGAPIGSNERVEAQKQLDAILSRRKHVDLSVEAIGKALFGEEKGPSMLNRVRPSGQALVDDWDCLKDLVKTYEGYCGSLRTYGKKYMRAFANLCNAGIQKDQMAQASAQACPTIWSLANYNAIA